MLFYHNVWIIDQNFIWTTEQLYHFHMFLRLFINSCFLFKNAFEGVLIDMIIRSLLTIKSLWNIQNYFNLASILIFYVLCNEKCSTTFKKQRQFLHFNQNPVSRSIFTPKIPLASRRLIFIIRLFWLERGQRSDWLCWKYRSSLLRWQNCIRIFSQICYVDKK